MPLFVVNSELDARGRRVPVNQPGSGWVGNLYQKGGNVFKYLMLTHEDISGQAGIVGPITPEQIQTAIGADGGTIMGWAVTDVPDWAINGLAEDGTPRPLPDPSPS